jgi:hypothetical protein
MPRSFWALRALSASFARLTVWVAPAAGWRAVNPSDVMTAAASDAFRTLDPAMLPSVDTGSPLSRK